MLICFSCFYSDLRDFNMGYMDFESRKRRNDGYGDQRAWKMGRMGGQGGKRIFLTFSFFIVKPQHFLSNVSSIGAVSEIIGYLD